MRKTTLAFVISSVLLGAVAAQAEPTTDPAQTPPAQTTAPANTSEPAGSSSSQEPGTGQGANNNDSVGTAESNVDKKSTSGSYYPNSAGTVGDTPTQPTSTSPEPNNGGQDTGPTNQWVRGDADGDGYLSKDEFEKISPTLVTRFDEMDVDSNGKLTRGEFRTWHESHKARMDADQPATSRTQGSSASGGNWSSTTVPGPAAAPSGTTAPDSKTAPGATMTPGSMMTPGTTAPGSTTAPTTPDTAPAPDDKGN